MKQIIFGIDYDEGNPDSYRAVTVSVRDTNHPTAKRKEHRFDSGFPPLDLIDGHNFLITEIGLKNILSCCWSSSVDHFVQDGEKYEWYEDVLYGAEWLRASKKFKRTDEFKKIKERWEAEQKSVKTS